MNKNRRGFLSSIGAMAMLLPGAGALASINVPKKPKLVNKIKPKTLEDLKVGDTVYHWTYSEMRDEKAVEFYIEKCIIVKETIIKRINFGTTMEFEASIFPGKFHGIMGYTFCPSFSMGFFNVTVEKTNKVIEEMILGYKKGEYGGAWENYKFRNMGLVKGTVLK